jgi:molybdate-binding protein
LYDDIENIKLNGKIIYNVIKFKKDFYYNSVKRKYGIRVATECILTISGLTLVKKDDYSLINRGKALNEGIEFIYLSRGKFFTDIHVKIL